MSRYALLKPSFVKEAFYYSNLLKKFTLTYDVLS